MQGGWGIGLRIPARPSYWENFNVPEFVEQLKNMTGKPSWVLINLSGPSNWGDSYLSYNPLLVDELGNVDATPTAGERDLFQELSDAIHAEGIKVIAYMAGQGPALLKLTTKYYDNIASGDSHEEAAKGTLDRAYDWDSVTLTSEARDNWLSWVSETYDCPVLQITWDGNRVNSDESFACEKQAYAEHIVTYYSNKFTTAIDGYWIDQGTVTNREMVTAACRSGNPDAVVAINHGAKMPLQVNNPGLEDYTFGHPTPLHSEEGSRRQVLIRTKKWSNRLKTAWRAIFKMEIGRYWATCLCQHRELRGTLVRSIQDGTREGRREIYSEPKTG